MPSIPRGVLIAVTSAILAAAAAFALQPGPAAAGALARTRKAQCLKPINSPLQPQPITGSADPGVVSQFAVLRTAPGAALPAPLPFSDLADEGVISYDPAAARLAGDGLYALPATLRQPTLTAWCARIKQLAAAVSLRDIAYGNGPGICLIRTANPATYCWSDAILHGYLGAIGATIGASGPRVTLVPDGVSSLTYTWASGRTDSVDVAANLATLPASLWPSFPLNPTRAQVRQLLKAHLPLAVRETVAQPYAIATYARPPALIADEVADYTPAKPTPFGFEGREVRCGRHRCIRVVVVVQCTSHNRCRMTRTIHAVSNRTHPTGRTRFPIAPIVARASRYFAHPSAATLVLTGGPQRRVAVVVAISCVRGAIRTYRTAGPKTLTARVPSRRTISPPVRDGAQHTSCDITMLVASRHTGAVHVKISR